MSASLEFFFVNEMRNDLADRCMIVEALVLLGRTKTALHSNVSALNKALF